MKDVVGGGGLYWDIPITATSTSPPHLGSHSISIRSMVSLNSALSLSLSLFFLSFPLSISLSLLSCPDFYQYLCNDSSPCCAVLLRELAEELFKQDTMADVSTTNTAYPPLIHFISYMTWSDYLFRLFLLFLHYFVCLFVNRCIKGEEKCIIGVRVCVRDCPTLCVNVILCVFVRDLVTG
jgi:hypothetical protein